MGRVLLSPSSLYMKCRLTLPTKIQLSGMLTIPILMAIGSASARARYSRQADFTLRRGCRQPVTARAFLADFDRFVKWRFG